MIERVEQVSIIVKPSSKDKNRVDISFDFVPAVQDQLSEEVVQNDPVLRAVQMVMNAMTPPKDEKQE